MKKATTFLILLLATALMAQKQDKPDLVDKAGRFGLWFDEASMEYPDKQTVLFDVSGHPTHGYSKDQNLEFSANTISGKLKKAKDEAAKKERLLIRSGALSGDVSIKVTDANGTSTISTAKATLEDDQESATVVVPGSFTFTNKATTAEGSRSMILTAAQATFVFKSLATQNENPLVSAKLQGSVKLVMNQLSTEGKTKLYQLTGQNMTLRSEGSQKVIVLSGDVHIVGEEIGGMLGDMTVSQATVTIDQNGDVKSMSTKGPGQGTIKDKKGG